MKNKKEFDIEDMERLSQCVTLLQGDRSLRKMAEDTGVAASYINGIKNKKYIPSYEILRSLANGNPQNDITLEDLMVASGYQEADQQIESSSGFNKAERRRNSERFTNMAKSLVIASIISKDEYCEVSVSHSDNREKCIRPDLVIKMKNEDISQWWFKAIYVHDEDGRYLGNIIDIIGRSLFLEPDVERKITYVINNEIIYKKILKYKNKLSYIGNLSILLIDEKTCQIIKEDSLTEIISNKNNVKEYKVM